MITEALRHCPGIGPVRLGKLHESGVRSWSDVLENAERIPGGLRRPLTDESCRCLDALRDGDVRYFIDHFAPQDRWRIVAHFQERISYFDIETTGLERDAAVTAIVCWHRGRLHSFVEHENLDEFLDLLDEIDLLGSFNGSSFDVPRILDTFHVPKLPCPHIDLRWSCYHRGQRGSLKQIAARLGIRRPPDLQDADGALAARLWQSWIRDRDRGARDLLVRYCAADVLLLVMIADWLSGRADGSSVAAAQSDVWAGLPCGPAARVSLARERPDPRAFSVAVGRLPRVLGGRRRVAG